jgi:hypothetical protein
MYNKTLERDWEKLCRFWKAFFLRIVELPHMLSVIASRPQPFSFSMDLSGI